MSRDITRRTGPSSVSGLVYRRRMGPDRGVFRGSYEADFARHRNRIGDLLLLPKQFNASYNDDPFEKKLPHYFGQNLLAASFRPLSYEKTPALYPSSSPVGSRSRLIRSSKPLM